MIIGNVDKIVKRQNHKQIEVADRRLERQEAEKRDMRNL